MAGVVSIWNIVLLLGMMSHNRTVDDNSYVGDIIKDGQFQHW